MLLFACISMLPRASARAQFRLQTQVGTTLELAREVELGIAERVIWGDGITSPGRYRTMLSLTALPSAWFSYSVGYQLYVESDARNRLLRHRLQADLSLRHRWGPVRIGYRARWQSTMGDARRAQGVVRNRVAVGYDFTRRVRVGLSGELFSCIEGASLCSLRTEASLSLRLEKIDWSIGYRYHTPWQGSGSAYHMLMLAADYPWDLH